MAEIGILVIRPSIDNDGESALAARKSHLHFIDKHILNSNLIFRFFHDHTMLLIIHGCFCIPNEANTK